MFKKLFCLVVFLSLALVLPVQPGSACDPPVFGPERFERGSGPPMTVTRGFAGSETGAEFEVWIRNGELYGRHRVTSGTIYLNGKKIVSSGELKAHVPLIRRRVSLNASNEIGVRLEGKPGSFLTVTIVDHRHPSVSLSASPQTIAPGGSSTLTWSSTDATICVIDHGVGWVAPTGSRKVRPRRTTTYTIYAYGHHEVVSAETTVTVGGSGPAAGDDVASTPEGTPVTVNVLANDTGSGLVLAGVTQGAHGAVSANADGTATYTPEPGFTGTDQFTYTVQDDHGATATGTVTITVTSANDAPVANAQTLSTNEDTAVSITLTGTDADGDTLSFTVTAPPAHGTLSGTAPNLTYTPAANYSGSDGFAFKVNDGKADSAAAAVSITVTSANDAPVANAQTLSTNEDTAVSITLTGTDADGDTLSFTVTTSPAHGTLSGTAPNLTYTPAAGYHGPDAFEFKVNDGKADSAAAAVSITVNAVNHPPAAADDSASTEAGKAVDIAVLANDTDPDGNTLLVSGFTQGANGSVSGGANGVLVYSPNAGFSGEDGFTYTVDDGNGGSASAAVKVTVNALAALSLTIVSPSEGAFIEGAAVMVRGTVSNATGAETGVTVNGVTAEVYGNEFVANHVVLVEGENTLTARAADTDGNALEASVVVNADPSADTIRIAANVESGIPSLEVTLGVRGSFSFSQSTIGCAGPAEPEYLETGAKEYKVRLSVEGIYYFTVEAVDNLNNVRADTAAIVVLNRNNLDALLQAKWDGMKAALIAGNSPGALAYFAASSRERYGEVFEHLAAGLPSIASGMREIELIYAKGGTAKYRIKREEQVQGQVYDITYYVYFLRDAAGIWGIDRF
ncbi:Ig-like domain-containing protein [Syntrophobacter fumaroxidans]|uniref:Putative outer membrane adhesin like protein n=1 Tax=Syntrophobacter fumaroxidans (strain DSM 10017 / MPOB) TaxID=335543 RepID=A0LKT6_SYNFM|nr:Ig-like domain-containing protein [Syntrophobacter fumaroxidans]ABK18038.1 putative outer membrane adhesin like protein [Syntrophobacter fumaroxidans MPOB]